MDSIANLEPQALWQHFANICAIPHPSGHELALIRYIENFAAKNHILARRDFCGNLILEKICPPELRRLPSIILQAHLDMVPQKNADSNFDFTRDPIQPYIDGEWVRARGTTLGADNGIGVAAILAVLKDNSLRHGPLKAILTIEEETGLSGALGLDPAELKADMLLNLDSEEENVAFIGCAGGVRTDFTFKIDNEAIPGDCAAFSLAVSGLRGGHSGMDIHLGRGNANKLLAALLAAIDNATLMRLASISGGSLDNAIPREAFATIIVPKDFHDQLIRLCNDFRVQTAAELQSADPGFTLDLNPAALPKSCMELSGGRHIIAALNECPNGVAAMHPHIPGLVSLSSNLAVIHCSGDSIKVSTSQRSDNDGDKFELAARLASIFVRHGAISAQRNSYPGWSPNPDSTALRHLRQQHLALTGKDIAVQAIHAGLECGCFKGLAPQLDMVSFGPEIQSPHSPGERVNIPSVARFHKLLRAVLENVSPSTD